MSEASAPHCDYCHNVFYACTCGGGPKPYIKCHVCGELLSWHCFPDVLDEAEAESIVDAAEWSEELCRGCGHALWKDD
jgi:hypothetical protein